PRLSVGNSLNRNLLGVSGPADDDIRALQYKGCELNLTGKRENPHPSIIFQYFDGCLRNPRKPDRLQTLLSRGAVNTIQKITRFMNAVSTAASSMPLAVLGFPFRRSSRQIGTT